MANLPDAVFVVDTNAEVIAIREARKLGIPVIGVADTNCDPDLVDYIIPGNDDALRAIRLITGTVSQAYLDGRAVFDAQQKELAEQMEKQRQLQAQQAAVAREAAARAAAEAAARRAAEAREGAAEAGAPAAETGEAAGKPRTTIKKTLQRKVRPRKSESEMPAESEVPAESAAAPAAGEEPAPAESAAAQAVGEEPEPTVAEDAGSHSPEATGS
jgi:small subunit ribosomal protein S2